MKTLKLNNKEYPNYLVSTDGLIYSKKSKKYLKPFKVGNYYCVTICDKGRYVTDGVHRIVASTYLPNPDNKECVHHIDEDRENNNVDNLEWMSREDHSRLHIHERTKLDSWGRPSKAIYCKELNKVFSSITECAKELNLNLGNIWSVLNGRIEQTGGYTFRYEDK